MLDPSPSWLHPLLHVPRSHLGWSPVNQGLVAAPGFDPICRVSLTVWLCFFPGLAGWAVAGWFIITEEICSVTRWYQLLKDTHTLAPQKTCFLSIILTRICVYIWHLWLQSWSAARPLSLFRDDEHVVPKLHCCKSGTKLNIVFLFCFFVGWWLGALRWYLQLLRGWTEKCLSFYFLALCFTAIPVFLELF